jgi:hypothetical protein
MTIIFFVACRDRMKIKEEEKKDEDDINQINSNTVAPIDKNKKKKKAAITYKGISIVVYSSELELQT